jgi:hypothetical protein
MKTGAETQSVKVPNGMLHLAKEATRTTAIPGSLASTMPQNRKLGFIIPLTTEPIVPLRAAGSRST